MPSNNRNIHNYIAGATALVIIVAIGAYLFIHKNNSAAGPATDGSVTVATTTSGDSATITGGSATASETNAPSAPVAPNYKTPLASSVSIDAAVQAALQKQFDATVAILDKDKTNFQAWANLGTLRKMTGDYKGAEADWIYVTKIYPTSTVGFDNLGELYLDFLKDYVKAEVMFKQSIKIDSHDINAYQQLFSLYTTYGYKQGTSAAADLVTAGLKANPNNQTLLQMQSQLKAQ